MDYLKAHGGFEEFAFFSFEHYPCGAGGGEGKKCANWSSLYWEPAYVQHLIRAWEDNGLPPNLPFYMTEGNDLEDGGAGTVKRGLWLADYVGSMMTAGASGTYYFHYIASERGGEDGFLPIDKENRVVSYPPQYLATQVITKEWVQPIDSTHKLFKSASDVTDKDGNILVTAYTVERPDGKWSVMLVNKDEDQDHAVKVVFADTVKKQNRFFSGSVERIVFGPAEYKWHADPVSVNTHRKTDAGAQSNRPHRSRTGYADPDGPASKSTITAAGPDTLYPLPKSSIIVLRGELTKDDTPARE